MQSPWMMPARGGRPLRRHATLACMSSYAAAPLPDDLPALRQWLAARPDAAELAELPIREIVVRSNALAGLPDLLSQLDAPTRLLLIQDDRPYQRGGASLKPLVHDLLAGAGRAVTTLTLPPGREGTVLADLENVERGRAAIGGQPTTVVALGSGTVCDVAKHACFLAEREDGARTTLVLVPTAASVTAFTSSLAVLLVDGVKRTRPSRFPDVVLCDLETIAEAPAAMTRAGLGDCVARFISYGDWYLAHQLGLVDRYSETPLDLMGEDLDDVYLEHAPLVAQGTPEGLTFLVRQVLMAGLAQSIVRISTPLSGTEHVVSHLLDMGSHAWGRQTALHGAQVGVATPLAARAYELLHERFDPGRPRPTPPSPGAVETLITQTFGPLDPSGRMAAECWRDYQRKLALWTAAGRRFDALRERWDGEVGPRLRELVRPSATIRDILRLAGHALSFEELDLPIPAEQARFALGNAHLIRERFVIGDLLWWLDLAGPAFADDLLAAGRGRS
ncbi:MAG: iron-containing alcohol dehydrogenase [Chloroflexi bacterium]|nr:iron-containing alcohol dehydrogenase [Chloroflexota bacterium]